MGRWSTTRWRIVLIGVLALASGGLLLLVRGTKRSWSSYSDTVILFEQGRVLTASEVSAVGSTNVRGEPPPSGMVRSKLEPKGFYERWHGRPEFVLTVETKPSELESVRLYEDEELVHEARIEDGADRSRAEIAFEGPLVGTGCYRVEVRTPNFVRAHDFRVSGTLPDPLEELRRVFGR